MTPPYPLDHQIPETTTTYTSLPLGSADLEFRRGCRFVEIKTLIRSKTNAFAKLCLQIPTNKSKLPEEVERQRQRETGLYL